MDGLDLGDIDAELARRGASAPGSAGVSAPGLGLGDIDAELARRGAAPSPAPQASQLSGPVANLGAGGNEALADIAGAPSDAVNWLMDQTNRVAGYPSRRDPDNLWTEPFGSNAIKSAMGLVGADPRNVAASDDFDRVARGTGQGAIGMVAPYAAGRAAIVRGVDSGLPGAVAQMFGGPAPADAGVARTALGAGGNAAIGGASGALGAEGENLLPPGSPYAPYVNFGGQLAGGGAVAGAMGLAKAGINAGAGVARDALGPLRRGSLEQIVGNKLYGASDDPGALSASLDAPQPNLVPGSNPTLFQATGDQGLGRLQSTLPSAAFDARAAEQNAARVGALQSVAPQGNAGAVRDYLQQHLDSVTAQGDANVAAAQQNAQQAMEQAGGRLAPEDYGALMRDQMEAAKAATKRSESTLWQAIDPDGKLTIDATPARDAAQQIVSDIPKTAQQPQGEELAVLRYAQMGGTAVPFSDFAALRGRLLQAIRDEQQNGQTPALRRMQMLRQAMDGTISATAARAADVDPALLGRLGGRTGDIYAGPDATSSTATAGGNGGLFPPNASNPEPQGVAGFPGANSYPGGGFGRSAGPASVPEPARPQDLIQFLTSRGGLKDEGGELSAMDLHKVNPGYFGRLSHGNGMPLDDARELAVENGYLHPDSDINDLLNALRRNQQGSPVFSENDPATADWRAYDSARRQGQYEPMPPLPGDPATFDAAAAGRYRAAADATRNRAQRFNNPVVGPALQERNGAYRIADSRLPERFISSPEGVQAYKNAGGDPGTMRDALVGDLRGFAINPDGSLNPTKFASWQMRRSAALRSFPDVQQTLGNAASAQQAVDTVAATARQSSLDFQRSAARHFLNAEPEQAVLAALNGRNPVGDLKQIAQLVTADPDAKAGLQRAVAEYMVAKSVRPPVGDAEVGTMNSAAFNRLMSRDQALGQVFSPEQMQAMRNIAADLQRASGTLPGGSAAAAAGKGSVLSQYLGHGIAALGGYLFGGFTEAGAAMGAYGVAKGAVDALKRAGIDRVDKLLTDAMLNPELARTLLMKATPGNRPFIAQRLASQVGTLAASAGTQDAGQRQQRQQSTVAPPIARVAPRRAMAPAAMPAPVWGSLAPGGALQQAVR